MKTLKKKVIIIVEIFLIIFIGFLAMNTYASNETTNTNSVTAQETNTETKKTKTKKQVKNGWDKNKKRYYINSKYVTGFKKIKGQTYYFNEKNGKKVTGLKKIKGSYYYFNSKGKMQTGWKKIKKNKYYFYPTKKKYGKAATGMVTIKGKKYEFKSNGKYVRKIDKMTVKANKLSSPTKYLILVSKKDHKVGIYKGKKGKWKRVKYYSCTIGAPSTPTPEGDYNIRSKSERPIYFDSGKVRCWYATRIFRGYYFHSVLYTQYKKPTRVANGRLGANLSHGCVRLEINNAKWIYYNIPANTRCIIY